MFKTKISHRILSVILSLILAAGILSALSSMTFITQAEVNFSSEDDDITDNPFTLEDVFASSTMSEVNSADNPYTSEEGLVSHSISEESLIDNLYTIEEALASPFTSGDGTAGNPYIITTAAELNSLRGTNCPVGTFFKLGNAIDLFNNKNGEGWEPISGKNYGAFQGNLDGNNHNITALKINKPNERLSVGLFMSISTGTISNLNLVNIDITGGESVGALVGTLQKGSAIINCSVNGGNINGNQNVGGLVGWQLSSSIDSSYATCNVSGKN